MSNHIGKTNEMTKFAAENDALRWKLDELNKWKAEHKTTTDKAALLMDRDKGKISGYVVETEHGFSLVCNGAVRHLSKEESWKLFHGAEEENANYVAKLKGEIRSLQRRLRDANRGAERTAHDLWAMRYLKDRCRQLEAQNKGLKPQWTPVSESLPEPYQPCLIYAVAKNGDWWINDAFIGSESPQLWSHGDLDIEASEAEITHWMPLPLPPTK